MTLTVLSVAYPFAPAGPDAVGGAEQVLTHIDEALVAAGHRSIVVACGGSRVKGRLIAVPRTESLIDEGVMRRARDNHRRAIRFALERFPVDVVHLHGIDFHAYLPADGPPVLVTLHMPVAFYAPDIARTGRPGVWFNCVAAAQNATCINLPNLLGPIDNGVPMPRFPAQEAKRRFALVLARICPEKGIHLAIDAAKRAGMPLLIAGETFGYGDHRRYFDKEIRPRLDSLRRFIGPVGFARKWRLLAAAHCVLVPSLVAETSSLVAREALAAGTPVVALARGALLDTIEHGRTGYLVRDEREMADAMHAAGQLDPACCREVALSRFSLECMTEEYLDVYQRLTASNEIVQVAMAS